MSKTIKYEPGEFSFHFRPNASVGVTKERARGKQAIDNFFALLFMFMDNGYFSVQEVRERLDNYGSFREVAKNGYKRQIK